MNGLFNSHNTPPLPITDVSFDVNGEIQLPKNPWPILAEEAYYGLAGEIVKTIEPYSEADPVAILINILTAFGSVIGSSTHFRVEYSKHPSRLFVGLVGETSKGRKGTSWSTIRHLLKCIDSDWVDNRVASGLSSGEGLIFHVRDPQIEKQPIKEHGKVVEYQEVTVDHGITDKRLLVFEEELASALKVMVREGNTLSATIRQAWDSGDLRVLTKNNPIKATGSHISVIGHITKTELLKHLTETEKASGFANRFVWLLVKRSKCISNPTGVPENLLVPLIQKLDTTISTVKHFGLIKRDPEAEAIWTKVYPVLSEGRPGLLGAITGRSEAQVMRLALIYAIIDGSEVIRPPHLKAALALWDYSETSAKLIFGEYLGDPTADKILEAIKTNGEMSDNDIHELFGRHKSMNEREGALRLLKSVGFIERATVYDTGGRPKTVWRLRDKR